MAAWFETDGQCLLDTGDGKALKGVIKRPAAALKGKTKKPVAALVECGDPDTPAEETEEKKKKTPVEEARAKASSMATRMSAASAKLLGVAAKTKKDQLTQPLLGSINDCRKALEQKRTTLMQLSTSPKSTIPELKAGTLAGAKADQDASDFAKLAKPFATK